MFVTECPRCAAEFQPELETLQECGQCGYPGPDRRPEELEATNQGDERALPTTHIGVEADSDSEPDTNSFWHRRDVNWVVLSVGTVIALNALFRIFDGGGTPWIWLIFGLWAIVSSWKSLQDRRRSAVTSAVDAPKTTAWTTVVLVTSIVGGLVLASIVFVLVSDLGEPGEVSDNTGPEQSTFGTGEHQQSIGRGQMEPTGSSDYIGKRWEWTFDGWEYYFEMDIGEDTYDYFRSQDRVTTLQQDGDATYRTYAYGAYVTNTLDDEFIQYMADEFGALADEYSMSEYEELSLVLAFVQSLEYTTDDVSSGFDEYPRYPIETLVEDGGDCEDTSILFASLVRAMGYGAIMLAPPGHMAVGVLAENDVPGAYYTYNGDKYLYAETTGDGWEIGEVPENYEGESAEIYDLGLRPLLSLGIEILEVDGNHVHAQVRSENLGSADSNGVRLMAAIQDDQYLYASDACEFDRLRPGYEAQCSIWLEGPAKESMSKMEILARVSDSAITYDEKIRPLN